ncbi:MAG: DUF5596 domain-containing protein [Oscillospiraceae bacterium]|nr:DUF5596 domain-containing protein [Oscillospiraceae bacterium]
MSKMTPLQLGQKLKLPAVSIEALQKFVIPEETVDRLKELFQKDPALFEQEARKEPDADLLVLALYLRWAMDTHYMYAIRGMDWEIFFDTFRDFTLWAGDFTEKTGRPGIGAWDWCGRLIKMRVFRLGRLEFEPDTLAEPLQVGEDCYPVGTRVVNVYIPGGEDTVLEAEEEALERAQQFFRMYYRQDYELFRCRSCPQPVVRLAK